MEPTNIIDFTELGGLALALALGLLVGLERGWAQRQGETGTRFAGIRTFGLLGLTGGVAGTLSDGSGPIATIMLAAAAVLIVIGYFRTSLRGDSISGTASVAGLLTLACGLLAATGRPLIATAIAVSMVLLLALRRQLHRFVGRLNEAEVAATARFALIAVVILPLLPDHAYGPYQAWNPRGLWLVVVMVSGFSFLGYIAAQLLGPARGTIATAAAGSMVSSTAVTAALAHRLKEPGESDVILHAAIAVASATMFLRVIVLTAWLAPFALPAFAPLAISGLVTSLIGAGWFIRHARRAHPGATATLAVKNPFDISPALLLMALVMAMTLIARWVLLRYGNAGVAVVLALSGSVDVDSAIITMGNLPGGTLSPHTAGLVLVPPVVLNTLFKAGAACSIAGWRRAWPAALVLAASALAVLGAVVVAAI
jgi:uncharacterized membrane protein (DUF4010 family)